MPLGTKSFLGVMLTSFSITTVHHSYPLHRWRIYVKMQFVPWFQSRSHRRHTVLFSSPKMTQHGCRSTHGDLSILLWLSHVYEIVIMTYSRLDITKILVLSSLVDNLPPNLRNHYICSFASHSIQIILVFGRYLYGYIYYVCVCIPIYYFHMACINYFLYDM